MTRGCTICQQGPAKKSVCCGQKLCDQHAESANAHQCPRAAELNRIANDPVLLKRWRAENAPEESVTTGLIDALNKLPGITVWRTKRRQGAGKSDELDGVLDISGFVAPEGIALFIETKRDHKPDCACRSCASQRDFAARAQGANCIVLLDIREVRAGVDGVRFALARRRSVAEPERAVP